MTGPNAINVRNGLELNSFKRIVVIVVVVLLYPKPYFDLNLSLLLFFNKLYFWIFI